MNSGCSKSVKGFAIGWAIGTAAVAIAGLLLTMHASQGGDMAGIGGAAIVMMSPLFGLVGGFVGLLLSSDRPLS